MDENKIDIRKGDYLVENATSLPAALGTALIKNLSAMQIYAEMSDADRREFCDGARGITSRSELRKYVKGIKKQKGSLF